MPLVINHSDEDYIVARQERYIEAWRSGSPERIKKFMHSDDFTYSNFSRLSFPPSHPASFFPYYIICTFKYKVKLHYALEKLTPTNTVTSTASPAPTSYMNSAIPFPTSTISRSKPAHYTAISTLPPGSGRLRVNTPSALMEGS